MAELFEQLLEAKFRDVGFPVTKFRTDIAHDLVEHKYWGTDGARVEATGLAPTRHSFTAPLTNGIVPGKNETWSILYPYGMRKLAQAFAKKATGALQHPEFGEIAVKAEKMTLSWDASARGGCECEMSFIETLIDGDTTFLDFPSPVQEVQLAALDLDASQTDLLALIPEFPQYEQSFTDFARAIQGIGDQVSILSYRTAGKINAMVYRMNQVGDSLDRAKNALTWPAKQNVQRMKSACRDLRQKLLEADREVRIHRVKGDTTLAAAASLFPDNTLGDIIRLNPSLMGRPVLPAGTQLRYYRSKIPI